MTSSMFVRFGYLLFYSDLFNVKKDENMKSEIQKEDDILEELLIRLTRNNEIHKYPFLEAVSRMKSYKPQTINEEIKNSEGDLDIEEIKSLSRFSVFRYQKFEK